MVVLADQQPFDVSNHANETMGWELTLVIPQSSNESDAAANSLF
jgi:spermidine/putrescine-binding protein